MGEKLKEKVMGKVIGIDTGGTLTKLAYLNQEGHLMLEVFPSNNMALVKDWLEEHPEVEEVGLTGGRTEQLREKLHTVKNKLTPQLVIWGSEFMAFFINT